MVYYNVYSMAVTTLKQMPHTEIDDGFFIQRFYLKNIKYKSLFR
jgi:hypothetical protein